MSPDIQFKLSSVSPKIKVSNALVHCTCSPQLHEVKTSQINLLDEELLRYLEERQAIALELDQAISLLAEQIRQMCRFIVAMHGKSQPEKNEYVN